MTKTTAQKPAQATTFVPVVTMEEVPVLSEAESAELLASLKESRADIAAGRFVELAADEIAPWLNGVAREARRKKEHGV